VYGEVNLPFADSRNYKVILESIRSDFCPSGYDWQYGVVNKLTGVLEMRASTLPLAVVVMQDLDSQLRRVVTGELNGNGTVSAATSPPAPPTGDIPFIS
jgi:hypothetical protein